MNPRTTCVVARVLIASVFVGIGIERLLAAAGWLPGRFPLTIPSLLFGIFELAAGIALLTGWQVARIALLMMVFLGVDAFMQHPFWNYGGYQQHEELLHFLKNFSTGGGLLLLSWMDSQEPRRR